LRKGQAKLTKALLCWRLMPDLEELFCHKGFWRIEQHYSSVVSSLWWAYLVLQAFNKKRTPWTDH
jgi:steroid 5-alpha reductase family enzyme